MSMNDLERDVCSRIAAWQQRMVDELTAWVAIPTGRGHASGLHAQRAALAHRLRQLGVVTRDITCERRPDWIDPPWESTHAADGVDILAAEHAGAGPRLLLSGHFDTVHDPHGSFRELRSIGGGRATGPGAADMKGGLVIALAALEAIRDAGHPLAWTFVLVPDEETGSYGSAAALRSLAPGHAAGFVFEPAGEGDSLIVERMGAAQFRIDAFGRAVHVGRDYAKGCSAVRALCESVGRAEALADPAAGRIVNIGPLQGGAVTNIVPDHASAWGNMRFASGAEEAHIASGLDALACGADGEVPRVRVRQIAGRPAKPLTPEVERLAHVVRGASEDLGRALPFGRTGGVCDGNNLQAAGLPTLDTLGVRGGNLHREDEWVDLDGMVDRAQLVALSLLRTAASVASTMRS
jgi:glutamate carboxypeptidase